MNDAGSWRKSRRTEDRRGQGLVELGLMLGMIVFVSISSLDVTPARPGMAAGTGAHTQRRGRLALAQGGTTS